MRARGLVLRRRHVVDLDGVDLSLPRNEISGLAGRADSGVLALCGAIATLRLPHDGDLAVLGIDPAREPFRVRSALGYVPGPGALPPNLHLDEFLRLRAAAFGVPRKQWPELVTTLLDLVGLGGRHRQHTHELPPGPRQLLAIAGALVHDPTVVLLEDPTAGLDERDRAAVWHLLHQLLEVSRTVVVAMDRLEELATACTTLAVFDDGHVVQHGSTDAVLATLGGVRRIRVRLGNGAVRTHTVTDVTAQAALLRKLVEAGLDIVEFTEVPPDLDALTNTQQTDQAMGAP